MPQYSTTPSQVDQSTLFDIVWPVDLTPQLSGDEVATSPSSLLMDLGTQQIVTLADDPTIDGNEISQMVRGSVLTATHLYRLTFLYVIGGNTLGSELLIKCPS